MTHPFPPPQIQPFERLNPSDGLLINAERWSKAHEYHRQRQNTYFQSLHQPGIVCGLGVRPIPAPRQTGAEYRDGRWVQIQPGIAIDVMGNLIVVSPQAYRDVDINLEVASSEPVMIYLVVSYVDPDELRNRQQRDIVQETYRIDQKISTPDASEIEICRIWLEPGQTTISQPADAFYPGYNNLDLRYRRHAQARPQALVRIAQVSRTDDGEYARNFFNLAYLLQSVEPLYSHLRGADEPSEVSLSENIQEYDLLYLTGKQSLSLNSFEFESLKNYLDLGGILLVDAPIDANALIESTHALAQQLETPLRPLTELQRSHPLRTKPFLFAALPIINQQPLQLFLGGGIILVVGDLASAWGIDREFNLPRLTIRTAQELGINILNYAWKRRQFLGLQQEDNSGQW